MPDTQVQNFISRLRAHAEDMDNTIQDFKSDLEQYQKLAYNPVLIDENAIGDNADVNGVQVDLAIAAVNDFITLWAGNAGTYLLEIER